MTEEMWFRIDYAFEKMYDMTIISLLATGGDGYNGR